MRHRSPRVQPLRRTRPSTRSWRRALAVTSGLLALVAVACVPVDPPLPTTTTTTAAPGTPVLEVTSTVGGFTRPWEIAVLPDGTPLVTERGGTVSAVVGGVRQPVAPVPGVVANGEGGLMGLAVDPAFATNRQIYTCLAFGSGSSVTDVRVMRFRLAEGLDGLTDATTILSGIPSGAGNRHLGCRLGVGPDGMLWITTGDAVLPDAPQDPTSRAGKVLRSTLSGDPAPGNPGGAWDPYVYTLGHRNPQGLGFRPSDGAAFVSEHGTGCDDEVNRLAAGANFGWDPVLAGGGYDENAPMTDPALAGASAAVWSSGCPTIAPSGATFVSGAEWGVWDDQFVMAVLKSRRLTFVRMDGSTLVGTDTTLTDRGRLRAVAQAPDGRLWVAQDSNSASLLVVEPT